MNRVPHLRVVVAFCMTAIAGYALFSVWVFGWTQDAALRGDVVGTWKSFAVLAFGFWIGSSSGGKSRGGDVLAGASAEVMAPAEIAAGEDGR